MASQTANDLVNTCLGSFLWYGPRGALACSGLSAANRAGILQSMRKATEITELCKEQGDVHGRATSANGAGGVAEHLECLTLKELEIGSDLSYNKLQFPNLSNYVGLIHRDVCWSFGHANRGNEYDPKVVTAEHKRYYNDTLGCSLADLNNGKQGIHRPLPDPGRP